MDSEKTQGEGYCLAEEQYWSSEPGNDLERNTREFGPYTFLKLRARYPGRYL